MTCDLSNGDELCTQGHGTRAALNSCNGPVCPSPAGRSWFAVMGETPKPSDRRSARCCPWLFGRVDPVSGRNIMSRQCPSSCPTFPPSLEGEARIRPPSHLHVISMSISNRGAETDRVASLRNRNFVRASRQTGLAGEVKEGRVNTTECVSKTPRHRRVEANDRWRS